MSKRYADPTEQLVLAVLVHDLDRSIEFYTRLGFELVRTDNGFAELSWAGNLLFLSEQADFPPPPRDPRCNVRVMVPNVDLYWTLALEMAARILAPISDRSYGLREFTIADPDGFAIRFASRIS
jgi:catechol 2,3-dioxygenase-like lactoylglutathione lyase family enzyme